MVDKPPIEDPILQRQQRIWEPKEHRPVLTWSRSAYKPYSTLVLFLDLRLTWVRRLINMQLKVPKASTQLGFPRQNRAHHGINRSNKDNSNSERARCSSNLAACNITRVI